MVRDGLIGGVVGIILTVLPLSTMLAGGVAGSLQVKGQGGAVARAGGLAGGIAFLPHLIVGPHVLIGLGLVPSVVSPSYLPVGVIGVGFLYSVGLGILGGLLGAYLRREHIDR